MFLFEIQNLKNLRLLVRNGANVNDTGDENATPLHFCTRARFINIETLLDMH